MATVRYLELLKIENFC